MINRFNITLCIMLFIGNMLAAQSFTTRVSANVIGKRDVLQIEYVAENVNISQFTLPALNIWQVISGPNLSSSSVQTGKLVRQQVVYSLIVKPKMTGTLVVPGATALINSRQQRSNSLAVIVKNVDHVAGAQQLQQTPPPTRLFDDMFPDQVPSSQYLKRGESATEKIRNNIIIRVEASRRSCFVGEPVLVTYKLCTRLRSKSKVVKQPSFSGCTVIEMTEDQDQHIEKIEGREYNVFVMRKVQLIPLSEGELVLPPVSVENNVSFYDASRLSARDMYYGNPAMPLQVVTVTMQSKPEVVHVKPLPPYAVNRSAGFSGAVGRFDIAPATDEVFTTTKTNNLQIVVKGEGNLQQIKTPSVAFPQGIETFDPSVKEETDKTTFPLLSKKIFSYPFVADKAGKYLIAPVSFTYFDPSAAQYVTKSTPSFTVNVVKGQKHFTQAKTGGDKGYEQRLYIILGLAVLLIIVGIFWYSSAKKPAPVAGTVINEEPGQPVYQPEKNEHLFKIRELQPTADVQLFYKQLHRYLEEFISTRLKIAPAELQLYILRHPFEAAALQELQTLLNHCSVGRYTPVYSVEEAMQHRLQAIQVVSKLL